MAPFRDGARIDVDDTGTGIDPSELPRIFERFYRGSRANEARGSGSGLGLAIVRSIVDMHGGTVTVDSRLGAGSRFSVFLPRDPRAADSQPPMNPLGRGRCGRRAERHAERWRNLHRPRRRASTESRRLTNARDAHRPCRTHAPLKIRSSMTDRRDNDPDDATQPHDSASFSPPPEPRSDWAAPRWTDPSPIRRRPSDGSRPRRDRAVEPVTGRTAVGAGVGTILPPRSCRRDPRFRRHGGRPECHGRARPDGRAGHRRSECRRTSSSRSRSTNPRRSSMSRRRPDRRSSGSGPARRSDPNATTIPEQGVGSGVIFNPERLDPHEPPRVVAGSTTADGRAEGRDANTRARSTGSTR